MRNIWQSDRPAGRLLRLTFVTLGALVPFFLTEQGLSILGASTLDARGGASIVALASAAFAMYC